MRTALLAALKHGEDGALRARLVLGGRSVLDWQVALAQALGCERIVCLCHGPTPELLALQRDIAKAGIDFHLLRGFVQVPALVHAEDDLVVVLDGLVPDLGLVRRIAAPGAAIRRFVAALSPDHPLASRHPGDFERIDATRSWAGLLVMRGAQAQQLADFPPDGDAISLLLRLALQARTECVNVDPDRDHPEHWLLAHASQSLAGLERALISVSAADIDWRAPADALAHHLVGRLIPAGIRHGGLVLTALSPLLLMAGTMLAASGFVASGLAAAAVGAFAARLASVYARLRERLLQAAPPRALKWIEQPGVDAFAALAAGLALLSGSGSLPLASLGPIAIGLARLAAGSPPRWLAPTWSDRTSQLALMSVAAVFDLLPAMLAALGLAALAQLLLREGRG